MEDDAIQLRNYAEQGAEEAFTRLVLRHLPLVFSVALRRVGGDRQLAQEVAQSVFVDVSRKAARLARFGNLAPWLYTATHFAAAKAVRADRRRRKHEQEAQSMQELNDEPTHDAAWAAIRPVLDDAMLHLKPRERDAVVLRFFDGRGFAEIGESFGLSESGARMRVERALDKLRGELQRRGVRSTMAALGAVLSSQAVAAPPAGLAASVATTALSSAGVGGGILTFINLLAMTKTQIGISAGIVLAGTAVVGVQEHEQAVLRDDIRLAEKTVSEAEILQTEVVRLEQVVAGFTERRDAAAAETASLRAEVANLKAQLEERAVDLNRSRGASPLSEDERRLYEMNELDRHPVPVERGRPVYPVAFKKAGLPGRVLVEMVVNDSGEVIDVAAVEATHPAFAAAAMEAVLDWKFDAGLKGGKPVNTRVRQVLDFSVGDAATWF